MVIKTNPRNFYDIPSNDEDEEAKSFFKVGDVVREAYVSHEIDSKTSLVRDDLNLDLEDAHVVRHELQHHKKKGKAQVLNDKHGSKSSDENMFYYLSMRPITSDTKLVGNTLAYVFSSFAPPNRFVRKTSLIKFLFISFI